MEKMYKMVSSVQVNVVKGLLLRISNRGAG